MQRYLIYIYFLIYKELLKQWELFVQDLKMQIEVLHLQSRLLAINYRKSVKTRLPLTFQWVIKRINNLRLAVPFKNHQLRRRTNLKKRKGRRLYSSMMNNLKRIRRNRTKKTNKNKRIRRRMKLTYYYQDQLMGLIVMPCS